LYLDYFLKKTFFALAKRISYNRGYFLKYISLFRVRRPGHGEWLRVHIAPGDSEAGVKEAVSVSVGLALGTFAIRHSARGKFSTFRGSLMGESSVVSHCHTQGD